MGAAKSCEGALIKINADGSCSSNCAPEESFFGNEAIPGGAKNDDYQLAHGGGSAGSDHVPNAGHVANGSDAKASGKGRKENKEKDCTGKEFWSGYFRAETSELRCLSKSASLDQYSERRHEFKTGAVYEGQWLGGERSGFGLQVWPDGARYEGMWKKNMATGKGEFRHVSGAVYIGQWRHNQAHGSGVYRDADRTTYTGEFMDDFPDGWGKEQFADKSNYAGMFCKGRKHWNGVYTWSDGSTLSGQWFDNQIHGCGAWISIDGQRFKGQWNLSVKHGIGLYTASNGESYAGQYSNGEKDGYGVFVWTDGTCYKGYWLEGQPVEGTRTKIRGDDDAEEDETEYETTEPSSDKQTS